MSSLASASPPQTTARRQLEFLKRQLWLIALVASVTVAVAAAVSLTQKNVYRANSKIFVGSSGTLNPQFGPNIQPFTQTMSSLLTSDIVAKRVVQNLGLNETTESVLHHLHVGSTPDSAVLQVSYDSHKPQEAVRILSEIGSVFTSLVRKKLGHPSVPSTPNAPSVPVVTATVFDPAHASPSPVSPHPVRTLAFAGVIGLALGIVLALLRDTLDERIRRREEMEELFGAHVMAVFPGNMLGAPLIDLARGVDPARLQAVDPVRLKLARAGSEEALITVTSGGPRDGQSAVAASVSVALALAGEHVICVDVSPQQRRSLSYYLAVPPSEAAQKPLAGPGDVEAALREIALETVHERAPVETVSAYLEESSTESLHEVPTAVVQGEGGRLQLLQLGELSGTDGFLSWSIVDLASELKSQAARIIVDAPALPSAATFAVLSVSDTAIVVGREGRTTKEQATQVRSALETLQVGSYALVAVGQSSVPVPLYGRQRTGAAQPSSSSRVRRAR